MPPADSSGDAGTGPSRIPLSVRVSLATDVGRRREHNEDAYCQELLPDGSFLFAVADGIGGHEGGEVASALAVATLVDVLRTAGPLSQRLEQAFAQAHRRILSMQRAMGQTVRGMGTTLTALALAPEGGTAVCAHVGDSRLYRWREGVLSILTEDHNVTGELVRSGRLDPALAAGHPQHHVLTRALGAAGPQEPDLMELEVRPRDLFLLATDGLNEALSDAEIQEELSRPGPFEELAARLVAAANRHGGPDNVTVVAVAVDRVGPQP